MPTKPYTSLFVDIFRDVYKKGSNYYGLDLIEFNFTANSTVEFRNFKLLKRILDADIKRELGHEPSEKEYYDSVRHYFKRGFCYCHYWTYTMNLCPTFNFSPSTLYRSYNKIISFKVPKKKNTFINR